jgi:hypothetical protein
LISASLVLFVFAPADVSASMPDYVREILDDAQQTAPDIPGQAKALLDLAWPENEGTDPDPLLRAAARQRLVGYGHHALPVIRRAIPGLDPLFQADATAALIEARYRNMKGIPPDYFPGLEEAIWYGSIEAQRIALNEIIRYNFPPAVLSSIDATYAHPAISLYVIRSLGRMGDLRAQWFIQDVLWKGADYAKPTAARALVSLGGYAINELRKAATSEEASVRQAAMAPLLPLTDTNDLTLLHEYYTRWTDDPSELREAARERALTLEEELQRIQEAEAASPIDQP